jgi:hypothetical protein
MSKARIFIVGCSRSGTTLVQSMLAAHPGLVSFPETQFFQYVAGYSEARLFGPERGKRRSLFGAARSRMRRMLRLSSAAIREPFETIAASWQSVPPRSPRCFPCMPYALACREFRALTDTIAEQVDAIGWVEKTPGHVHYVELIERYFPDAAVVHVVREGLEVVRSLRTAAERYPGSHWSDMYPNVERCVWRWNQAIRDTTAVADRRNHHIVRFEDLLSFPRETVHALCTALDLDFRPEMIHERDKTAPALYSAEREPWKTKVTAPVGKGVTRQDQILTEAEESWARGHLLSTDAVDRWAIRPKHAKSRPIH